jgi:hypothetical protein
VRGEYSPVRGKARGLRGPCAGRGLGSRRPRGGAGCPRGWRGPPHCPAALEAPFLESVLRGRYISEHMFDGVSRSPV